MIKKSVIAGVAVVAIIAIAVVAFVAFSNDDGYKPPKEVNHYLDTETTKTVTWSYINGWDNEYVFVKTSEKYGSPLDTTKTGMYYEHDVVFEPGSTLPDGVSIKVRHNGWDYWGYAWIIDGASGSYAQGTWTGTVTYTVKDSSEYNGTVHTLHYTLTNDR